MNSDPNDFEALRKLMAVKKHEQPPPEYLDQLSNRIISRIEHGEGQLNLWERLTANFSLRPAVAYAFGLTVCGALGLSAVYMVRQEVAQTTILSGGVALRAPAPAAVTVIAQEKPEMPALHVAGWLGNTNPANVTQPELPLFGPSRASSPAVPVSYHQGN